MLIRIVISRWVDEVVEQAPWVVTQEFMDKHKVKQLTKRKGHNCLHSMLQIDYVAHGEDIILDQNGVDIYKFVKDQGKYQVIKRTDGISTSDIILRIVKYVKTNRRKVNYPLIFIMLGIMIAM